MALHLDNMGHYHIYSLPVYRFNQQITLVCINHAQFQASKKLETLSFSRSAGVRRSRIRGKLFVCTISTQNEVFIADMLLKFAKI